VLQILVGVGLLNVWLLRPNKPTPYRGGGARSLEEEFALYGLPDAMRYVVGVLKVGAGIIMLAGVWWPVPVREAAIVVVLLMVGAIAMHIKVKDPARRAVPAVLMLVMCLGILVSR
jgi:hypothetical protein